MSLIGKIKKITESLTAKIGIALGFMAATAVGILGGIDAALMFPAIKLPIGLIIGGSSCFVNSVSYFYVVSKKDTVNSIIVKNKIIYKNTFGSTTFILAAASFIGITFVANFVGMYIGFTVLGGKLDLNWPAIALQIPGAAFGVCSAVSGLIYNIKVAAALYNRIREMPVNALPASQQPLLINEEAPVEAINQNPFLPILRRRPIPKFVEDGLKQVKVYIKPKISIDHTFFARRDDKLVLPETAFDPQNNLNRHKRSNSM